MNYSYRFPAVSGLQAGKEYYISMVPLKLLPRLFPPEDEYVPPEYRAQRRINEARIPEITKYILDNRDNYVFSALSASIDGNFSFLSNPGSNAGILEIDMSSVFMINDGQHRKAAIEAAMLEDPSLGEETIPIVFFKDDGLSRSQQMFTDLNKHAVRTSNSLATLYDGRDEIAVATRHVIDSVPFFQRYTDKERDILGKNSSNLFTLNMIYKSNQRILRGNLCSEIDLQFLIDYWNAVAKNIPEWNEVMSRSLTKKALRENYIVCLAVTINAFGRLGRYFYDHSELDMEEYLSRLHVIDWARTCSQNWSGRTILENGKIASSEEAVLLTCSKIKELIGVDLSREELVRERKLDKGNDHV